MPTELAQNRLRTAEIAPLVVPPHVRLRWYSYVTKCGLNVFQF